MRIFGVVVLVLFVTPWLVAGTLAVEILDVPSTVWTYSPVYLTVAVTNHGSEGLLVDCRAQKGFEIEAARDGQDLKRQYLEMSHSGYDQIPWLEPGERWLVRLPISRSVVEPGAYRVRVRLRGPGTCLVHERRQKLIPLEPTGRSHSSAILIYDCWSGEAYSEVVTINSTPPPGECDAEALDWLRSDDFPGFRAPRPFSELSVGYILLRERFPQSHYTYVGGLHGAIASNSTEAFQEILRLQPSHPLTPYTRLELALMKLRLSSPFSVSEAMEDLPKPLAAYLEQTYRIRFPDESEASAESQGGSK